MEGHRTAEGMMDAFQAVDDDGLALAGLDPLTFQPCRGEHVYLSASPGVRFIVRFIPGLRRRADAACRRIQPTR